uniref:OTU domain-containing protein n=1 Tax=Acrobeloides nanus TaxID=290746 RepID=A0A914D567_9BILA
MQWYLKRRDPALNEFDIIPGRADLSLDQLTYNDFLESEESDIEEWDEDENPQIIENMRLKKQIKTLERKLEKTTISSPPNHVKNAHSKTAYLEKPESSKKYRKNISNNTVPQNQPDIELILQKAPETHFKLCLPTLIWRRKNVIKLSGFNETMVQHIYPHDSIKNFENLELETLYIRDIHYTKNPESKNIKKVAKDGNCLFRALAYCITGIDYVLDQMHEDATNVHKKMREATCRFLEQHLTDTNIENLVLSRIDSPQDQSNPVDAYLKSGIRESSEYASNKNHWGSHVEIRSFASIFKCLVYVWDPDPTKSTLTPKWKRYTPIWIERERNRKRQEPEKTLDFSELPAFFLVIENGGTSCAHFNVCVMDS